VVDPYASRIPVTLITGFLGSGKTTLLGKLLRHPGMNRAAVVINEFGDVPLDHELVESSSEQMTLLSNGCLCCTLRTDLQETLRELFVKRRAGEVIDFDRVFVETTGLADPIPVMHTLQTDGLLGAQYRLNGVVTVVDAVNGMGQLDSQAEAVKQAAVADRVVVSKTDLAGSEAQKLIERVRAMNPYAEVKTAVNGDVDPAWLAAIAPSRASASEAELERWLPRVIDAVRGMPAHNTAGIESFCLWFDKPFTWPRLNAALQILAQLRGPDLLRMKGIVHVEGEAAPVVIQGAQHVFHPPVALAAGGTAEPRSRIVFIVRNIQRAAIESLFNAVSSL
jgi:G3E family GTPase